MKRYRLFCTKSKTWVCGNGISSWTYTFIENDAFNFKTLNTLQKIISVFLEHDKHLIIQEVDVPIYVLYNSSSGLFYNPKIKTNVWHIKAKKFDRKSLAISVKEKFFKDDDNIIIRELI